MDKKQVNLYEESQQNKVKNKEIKVSVVSKRDEILKDKPKIQILSSDSDKEKLLERAKQGKIHASIVAAPTTETSHKQIRRPSHSFSNPFEDSDIKPIFTGEVHFPSRRIIAEPGIKRPETLTSAYLISEDFVRVIDTQKQKIEEEEETIMDDYQVNFEVFEDLEKVSIDDSVIDQIMDKCIDHYEKKETSELQNLPEVKLYQEDEGSCFYLVNLDDSDEFGVISLNIDNIFKEMVIILWTLGKNINFSKELTELQMKLRSYNL